MPGSLKREGVVTVLSMCLENDRSAQMDKLVSKGDQIVDGFVKKV